MIDNSIKNFYDLTTADPLFAAEGLDLENATSALQELKKVTKELEIIDQSLQGKLYFTFHPLTTTLHPFAFLEKFLESEFARRRFLAIPTLTHAKGLISSYYRTLHALEKDLMSFRKACLDGQKKTIKSIPTATTYNFYQKKISFVDFIGAIDLMINNSQVLRKEIDERSKILLSSMQESLQNTNIKKKKTIQIKKVAVDPIPEKIRKEKLSPQFYERMKLAIEGRDFTFFLKQRYGEVTTELYGPIYYELKQFDAKPTVHNFFVSIAKDKNGIERFIFPVLADEYHFLELAEEKYKFYADIYIYESLIKRSIPYWYQPATMFYFASDLSYYPDLATIVDLKKRPFLNRQKVLSQKSSLLDLLLWSGYYHNLSYLESVKSRIKAGKKVAIGHYLLIARSYPTLYFLPFNRSVWRLKEKANFLGSSSKYPEYYTRYEKLPAAVKKKYLKKIFEGGRIRVEDVNKFIADS